VKRAVSTVAKEIGAIIDRWDGFAAQARAVGSQEILVQRGDLARWLLLLCPPRTGFRKTLSDKAAERRTTKKQLDAICREMVFRRDENKCRKCGRTDRQLQWCHVYPKGAHPWLRWDLDNSFCGCSHCHLNWWHARPKESFKWWEKEIGSERWRALVLRAAKPRKVTPTMVKLYLEHSR
jgi:5-methylcytosine-specific restriction endonuclease McrA